MKATLREKRISNNKIRLYIDYYPPIITSNGKATRREVLDLYIFSKEEYVEEEYITDKGNRAIRIIPVLDKKGNIKPIKLNARQIKHNKETLQLAENIRSQRQLQIQKEDYGFISHDKNADFLDFFKQIAEEKKKTGDTNYYAAYNFLKSFCNEFCPVSKLTPEFCNGFKEHLTTVKPQKGDAKKRLASSSQKAYWSIFHAVINRALKRKMLKEDPTIDIVGLPRTNDKQREYLTYEELKTAATHPCDNDELKRACLFSALTGLRHSDIINLIWQNVVEENGGYYIRKNIKKTKEAETLPISADAFRLLNERKKPTDRVFPSIKKSPWQNGLVKRWLQGAGIYKHITFHCFRHTFATIQLTLGTDIYTVSKMLGHKSVLTTQIYAKIVDEKKLEAANKMTL